MARPKKDGRYFNCYMNNKVLDDLEKYCEETGLTKTMAIERILAQYFAQQSQKKAAKDVPNNQ